MAKDNEQIAREHALAREFEKKMVARNRDIVNKAASLMPPPPPNSYRVNNLHSYLDSKIAPAFAEKKYEKPSQLFLGEMSWLFGQAVYDRFRDAFLYAVDNIRDYPFTIGWGRRSFRSRDYRDYAGRIKSVVLQFADNHCIDADLCDILTGNLPEDALCYLKTRNTRTEGFPAELLAYELDQDNPRLEAIVTDIINGDSEFSTVSRVLIRGIVLSHNSRMHQLLCRLLLAARLQEGLRQAICEDADWGTQEAFHAILSTILEHNLIRYSSIKRAVGTWIGIVSEETRDLDRVSTKSVELIRDCLMNEAYREECLESEDAMAIHIALWSTAFDNIQRGFQMLDRIINTGTHHQVLTAGYFVANLEDLHLRHEAARKVLSQHRDRYDIWAVYLPNFLPYQGNIARDLVKDPGKRALNQYFESPEQAFAFCDWLVELHGAMKKKELEFSPCIFPWFSASLKKADLIEKAMVLAVLLKDQQRIDSLCPCITDCDTFNREHCLAMLTQGKKTPAVRKAIVDGLQDKSSDTRKVAFIQAKGMELTAEEYLRIEDMLRLRYEDLRRYAMELLMKQSDGALRDCIRRLLASAKSPMRTAGLDMVTQLNKSEDRRAVAESCMEAVCAMDKPTTQEKILIDALMPKQEEKPQGPLFTEADRYIPPVEIGDYEKECIRAFMEVFPDSKLEKQIAAGKQVTHNAVKLPALPSASAKNAQKNLKSLSDFIVTHERDTYRHFSGREAPIGTHISGFYQWKDGHQTVPGMDLWEQWRDENQISAGDLYGMMILGSAQADKYPYLIRCGKYICDIYGNGFEKPVTYRYADHMQRIVYELLRTTVSQEQQTKIALALGIWIAGCLPEEMLIGDSGEKPADTSTKPLGGYLSPYADAQVLANTLARRQINVPVGHFIAHPQFSALINQISPENTPGLEHRVPVLLNIYERTYAATGAYLANQGSPQKDKVTLLLSMIYLTPYRLQPPVKMDVSIYLYAFHYGLISDRTLYCNLMDPVNFKSALQLVTGVCAMEPKDGDQVSARTFRNYHSYGIRRSYEEFIGKENLLREEQIRLVELCHRIADKLVPIVVGAELRRGDTPTDYSVYVTGIHMLSGMDYFVRILSAMGKDSLDRSVYYWGINQSKRGNLSYLLARCAPEAQDNAEKLAAMLKDTDITEKRLIEAALYSPAWIDIIGDYLNLPGFKSACYYFMAHMNEKFDDQKKAIIARYSPLSEDELNLGAFDVDWFRSAYAQLGEKRFDLIYDAAKYISDGSKHTRARKFADAALGKLKVADTKATVQDKRNKDLLMAYAIIPLEGEEDLIQRYLYLQQFLKESRQFGAQRSASEKKAVEAALRNLATNAGFSDTMRLTLRMETKLVEDSRELFDEKKIGEWVFRLVVDEQGSAEIQSFKDGKQLKSIPAKAKKDAYVVRLQDMKKQLTEQYRRTRRMFEQAMEDSAEFTLEEMRQLSENRVVAPIVSKLIFKCDDKLGLFHGGSLKSLTGDVLTDDAQAKLTVAHPLHLFQSGSWSDFQKYLYDNQIIQPFRQVFRELYVKTKEELGCLTSLRYAGNQIQPKKAAACLKERRWVADIEAGLQKIYYRENIVATIYALADWFTPADIEAPTLEHVAFYDRKTGKGLRIDDIPDVIFSEVMRDVDMAVSVAHAGGVDPETSHSTVEMRAAILSFTLPLLRLKNVRVEGSHAFIDGKLASYSVHLGSGVVHQIGGAMLSVLPVHSQHRGRFFLPFVDEDPKTAEIISKVILFAEDQKLKDPSILEQISR